MRFITLSSDSSGNGYLLRSNSGETLIVEAGVRLSQVKKTLDFDLSKIAGCIVSHSHNDHAKYINEYLKAGIKCYIGEETNLALFGHTYQYNVKILQVKEQKSIGEFLVKNFPLEHDVQNFGFLIHHFEMGLIVYIIDTNFCHYNFKGLNNILIEANYANDIIDQKLLDRTANLYVRDRVLTHHMEFETCKEFLKANDLSKVNNIILLHLSMANSDKNRFIKEVTELTGKQVFVAEEGLNIELNKTGI